MAVKCEQDKPHASTHVCIFPIRQDAATAWLHDITGHEGVSRTLAEACTASTRAETGK